MLKKKIFLYPFILLILGIFISFIGCGGGDKSNSVINPESVSSKGTIEVTANWPEEGKDIEGQVIPPGVLRIEITITGEGLSSPSVVNLYNGERTVTIPGVPAGEKQVEFKGLDGMGHILCYRLTHINVVANQVNPLSVILGVAILGTGYCPGIINISVGDTLYWVNNDTAVHTITCSMFDSKDILPGGEFSYTFDTVGTYNYYCSNCGFKGVVIVGGVTHPTPSIGPGHTATPTPTATPTNTPTPTATPTPTVNWVITIH